MNEAGSAWYDLVADPHLNNPIADLNTINGDGGYTHTNMDVDKEEIKIGLNIYRKA